MQVGLKLNLLGSAHEKFGSEPGRRRQNVIKIKGHQAAFNEQAAAVKRFETFIYIFIF